MDDKSHGRGFPISVFIVVVLILLLWQATWWGIPWLYPDHAKAGQFGDMFGAVNALFSGLALAGVVVAIWLQSRELGLQREELRLTRNELSGKREQLERQGDTSHRQRLESMFFQLLQRHNEVTSSMAHPGNLTIRGRECFRKFANALGRNYDNRARVAADHDESWRIRESFDELWRTARPALGPYVGNLQVVVKFLCEELGTDRFFRDVLVAQLSDEELGLFVVYGRSQITTDAVRTQIKQLDLAQEWRNRQVPEELRRQISPFLE